MNSDTQALFLAGPIHSFLPFVDAAAVSLVNETVFPKHAGFRNQIEFVAKSGKQSLSIPLQAQSRKSSYQKVEISYKENWPNHLINALQTAYGKSPFFEYYDYKIEAHIRKQHQYLWDFNFELLQIVLQCLKIDSHLQVIEAAAISTTDALPQYPNYYQVFAQEIGFTPHLSILDLLFNEGVDAYFYLQAMKNKGLK